MPPRQKARLNIIAEMHQPNTAETFDRVCRLCLLYTHLYSLPDPPDIAFDVVLYRQCAADRILYAGTIVHNLHQRVYRQFDWTNIDTGVYLLNNIDKFAATWYQITATCSLLVALFYGVDAMWPINEAWQICAAILRRYMPDEMADKIDGLDVHKHTLVPECTWQPDWVYRDVVVAAMANKAAVLYNSGRIGAEYA